MSDKLISIIKATENKPISDVNIVEASPPPKSYVERIGLFSMTELTEKYLRGVDDLDQYKQPFFTNYDFEYDFNEGSLILGEIDEALKNHTFLDNQEGLLASLYNEYGITEKRDQKVISTYFNDFANKYSHLPTVETDIEHLSNQKVYDIGELERLYKEWDIYMDSGNTDELVKIGSDITFLHRKWNYTGDDIASMSNNNLDATTGVSGDGGYNMKNTIPVATNNSKYPIFEKIDNIEDLNNEAGSKFINALNQGGYNALVSTIELLRPDSSSWPGISQSDSDYWITNFDEVSNSYDDIGLSEGSDPRLQQGSIFNRLINIGAKIPGIGKHISALKDIIPSEAPKLLFNPTDIVPDELSEHLPPSMKTFPKSVYGVWSDIAFPKKKPKEIRPESPIGSGTGYEFYFPEFALDSSNRLGGFSLYDEDNETFSQVGGDIWFNELNGVLSEYIVDPEQEQKSKVINFAVDVLGFPPEVVPDISNSQSMSDILDASSSKFQNERMNFYKDGEDLYKNIYEVIELYNTTSKPPQFQKITNP